MIDILFQPKKEDGWIHLQTNWKYPEFFKDIEFFFADIQKFVTGQIIISGGDNKICVMENGKYYDLDKYFTYWRLK
jgi:hypothetical protein